MSIDNYTELLSAVSATWPHRADLTGMAADFITLGEARLNRKLRIKAMEESSTITPSQSVRYVALPTGYLEAISFTDDIGDTVQPLSSDSLERAASNATAGHPDYYRISSRIDFERVADSAYSYTLRHYKRLDIAADATNTLLTTAPDIYLFAALVNAERYVKNDNRFPMWKAELNEAISELNSQSKRSLQSLRTDIRLSHNSNILNDQ
jgi:hypothetical protein